MKVALAFLLLYVVIGADIARAHGGHVGGHAFGATGDPRAVSFGRPGDPKKVSRAIPVEMDDGSCRLQAEVRLRQGDTVRFNVRNSGTRMHELVLGTSHELREHVQQAERIPGAEHDEPFVLHVEPGTRESLVWRFTRVDLLSYGCLIHGTGETRMAGRIVVAR